jgi:chromosome segregation ATPase
MSNLDPTDGTVDDAIEAAADEVGVDREELLRRTIVSLADEEGIDVPDGEEVAALESRVDDLDAEVDEKVADLRERFVELYRDLEAKAPADHAHAETAERLDALAADLDRTAERIDELEADAAAASTADGAVEERVGDLDARLADVESRTADLDELEARVDAIDADDLDDRLGEIDDKLSRVAGAVVRVRRRLEAAERDRADRERLDALAGTANRNGVRKAACTDCGETVDVGLLTEPECPHCGREFAELEPNPGFLGTSRLVVSDQPALDGDVDDGSVSTRDTGGDR